MVNEDLFPQCKSNLNQNHAIFLIGEASVTYSSVFTSTSVTFAVKIPHMHLPETELGYMICQYLSESGVFTPLALLILHN